MGLDYLGVLLLAYEGRVYARFFVSYGSLVSDSLGCFSFFNECNSEVALTSQDYNHSAKSRQSSELGLCEPMTIENLAKTRNSYLEYVSLFIIDYCYALF